MAVPRTNAERLVVLETKVDAVLESQREIIETMKAIQTLQADYVKKQDYEADISELHTQIKETRSKTVLNGWLTGVLATIFGIVMTILVQSYFSH